MTSAEMDELVRRANRAGFDTVADYAVALERVLWRIADHEIRVTRGASDAYEIQDLARDAVNWPEGTA